MTTQTSTDPDTLHASLEKYNWDDDAEFQSGLSAILGSNPTPDQAAELTLRARCFYYSRKYNTPIDFDSYKAYRATHPTRPLTSNGVPAHAFALPDLPSASTPTPPSNPTADPNEASGILPAPSNPSEPPAPYPTSFAHIVELVTTGQPIPGIKQIPDTVLTGQGSEGVRAKRRKPWEKDEVVGVGGSGQEATS